MDNYQLEKATLVESPIRYILWTSGWDSTFRVLYSVLVDKVTVKPVYVLDPERQSFSNELANIAVIKRKLTCKSVEAANLLLDLEVLIKPEENDEEYKHYKGQLKSIPCSLGDQYIWLALLLNKFKGRKFELCVMYKDDPKMEYFNQYMEEVNNIKTLSPSAPENLRCLFSCFNFPSLNQSKMDFYRVAAEHNFLDLMEFTWFCHSPVFNQPCGICVPCKDARYKYDMKFRFSKKSLYLFSILKVIRQKKSNLLKRIQVG